MQTYSVYFRPRGSLASAIGSDTLFGAVCWGIRMLGLKSDVATWLGSSASPPFAFGAPFPVWFSRDGAPLLRLYPLPATFSLSQTQVEAIAEHTVTTKLPAKKALLETVQLAKQLKKAVLVSEEILAEVVEGRLTPESILQAWVLGQDAIQQVGGLLLSKAEAKTLLHQGIDLERVPLWTAPVQHNSVDRVAGATVEGLLFYTIETYFAPQTGLWALLRAEPQDVEQLIRPALRYLEDTGLGANRTVGKGHFYIDVQPAQPLPAAHNPNAVMLLSRYLPAEGDGLGLDGSPLAYRLFTLRPRRERKFTVAVEGQATPPVFKQPLRVFEPGSVFPLRKLQEIYGAVARVVSDPQDEAIYQSGAALPLLIYVQEATHGQ